MSKKIFNVPIWVIGLLMLLTLLIEAPLIAFPIVAGDAYRGINIAPYGNDEHHYLTRGKEVLEGHSLGQPYLREWKEKPDSFQSNAEYALMVPFRIAGFEDANVVTLYNILNAIGVFVLLLLIYIFVFALSGDVLISATCAVFTIGGYVLLQNGTVIMWLLRGNDLIFGLPNIFGRSTDPYTALVPFFGFLILTYYAVFAQFERFSRSTWQPYAYVLGAGSLFGILFYDYFYAWTFALAFLGSLFLTSLLWKKWQAALVSALIGVIGVMLAAPMLIGFVRLFTSPLGEQFAFFFLTDHSRAFIGSTTGVGALILFAIYWYVRRDDRNNFFLLALIAAGWIALEQQMITGRIVQYGHYYWYFVAPLSLVVSIYMVANLFPKEKRVWGKLFCGTLIAVALLNTVGQQYTSFFSDLSWKMREQDFAPVIEVLKKEQKGVVLADPSGDMYPFLVTIFTDHDLYWHPAGIASAYPMDRLEEVLLVYLYINKDSRRDPVGYLQGALASTSANVYTDMYEALEAFDSKIPMQNYWKQPVPHTAPNIFEARSTFLPLVGSHYTALASSREKILSILTSRDVRYILSDERKNPEWDLSGLGSLTVLATSTDITLYVFSTTQ
ncbi:MAG: hypothetical protein Q8R25_00360 [bacterium]|nr:hypothetical protein [bacterium]